jgi:NAD(P)-dependent dehydrogenase (short-subunit alcohol dehydrogenase family)
MHMSTTTQKLTGKVAIVTGASKGIGAAIATHLAAAGASVVVNYSSSKEGADRVVDTITKRGGKAIAAQANVAKKADLDRLFAEAKKAFNRVDILVNNAGIFDFKPLAEVTEEHFHKQFDINERFCCSRGALPRCSRRPAAGARDSAASGSRSRVVAAGLRPAREIALHLGRPRAL